jgi:hypothetical protein
MQPWQIRHRKKRKKDLLRFLGICFIVVALGYGGYEFFRTPPKPKAVEAIEKTPSPTPVPTPVPNPVNYSQRFCEEPHEQIFDADYFLITLEEGCFSGPIRTPKWWHQYQVDKSQHEGDWASAWCNGHPKPGPIRPFYEDFNGEFKDCGVFYLQGKGKIRFTMVTRK